MVHKISFDMCIFSDYSNFWKFIFHKVVQRRSKGVVGYLIIALLQIYDRVWQVKEFLKSVKIWQRCGQKYGGMFFWLTVYM